LLAEAWLGDQIEVGARHKGGVLVPRHSDSTTE
jgi:hypothetical protein